MANTIIWRDEAEKFLSENGWKLFLDKLIDEKAIVMRRLTIQDKLDVDLDLKNKREMFRQALADLGHSEATVYSHWALEAFDRVHGSRG